MRYLIFILLPLAGVFLKKSIQAQCPIPQNNNWTAEQIGNGFNDGSYSLHINAQGDLFAGGQLTEKVVQWNGNTWIQVGTPFGAGSTGGRIFGLKSIGGDLFAVGNNSSADLLQKWDGNIWSKLIGSNITSYSIAIHNSSVYVGHTTNSFFNNGIISYEGVFEWNTNSQTISALGDGLTRSNSQGGGAVGIITALVTDSNGDLYASGGFDEADGIAVNNFAKWNGSSWSAVGGGLPGGAETLVFSSNGDLYAGGYFTTAGSVSANHVAIWNGTTWSALGSGLNGDCFALAFDSQGNLYAGGDFSMAGGIFVNNLAKWDGSSWSAVGMGVNASVQALVVDDCDRLIVGGEFTEANGTPANRIAMFYTECNLDTSVTVNSGTLSSNASNVSYQWLDCNNGNSPIPGANSSSYTPSATGNYAVIVSDQCADTSACRKVCVGPSVSVSVSNTTLTATPAGLNYQWIDCNNGNSPIAWATGQFYTATENGSYAVEVEENACFNISNCTNINFVNINEAKGVNANMLIYPNPAENQIIIDAGRENIQRVSITSISGKQLMNVQGLNTSKYQLNLDIKAGIYLIEVYTIAGISINKLIIN